MNEEKEPTKRQHRSPDFYKPVKWTEPLKEIIVFKRTNVMNMFDEISISDETDENAQRVVNNKRSNEQTTESERSKEKNQSNLSQSEDHIDQSNVTRKSPHQKFRQLCNLNDVVITVPKILNVTNYSTRRFTFLIPKNHKQLKCILESVK